MPECVDVRLALDQDDMAGVARLFETIEPIELRFRARLPAKAVPSSRNSEPHCEKLAAGAEIRHANSRSAAIGNVGQSTAM